MQQQQLQPHPVDWAWQNGCGFFYFHTHVVDSLILERSIRDRTSIELDVYGYSDGTAAITHPPLYYTEHNKIPPKNLSLDYATKKLFHGCDFKEEDAITATDSTTTSATCNILVVLDCKNKLAIPHVARLVSFFGPHRTVVHGFVSELTFKPFPDVAKEELHWEEETVTIADLQVAAAGVVGDNETARIHMTCRGLTLDRILDPDWKVTERILTAATGVAAIVGLWLPLKQQPPVELLNDLRKKGNILPCLHLDDVLCSDWKALAGGDNVPFWAMTDDPAMASLTPLPSH